jgi:methyl-accepting chemotaxis protein
MSEMDKVTQSNAAGAEESASAAHELAGQSTELREAVEELNSFTGFAGSPDQADDSSAGGATPHSPVLAKRNGTPAANGANGSNGEPRLIVPNRGKTDEQFWS